MFHLIQNSNLCKYQMRAEVIKLLSEFKMRGEKLEQKILTFYNFLF